MSVASAFLQSLLHPSEVYALIKYKLSRNSIRPPATDSPSLKRCYEFLNLTSRSFAAVIQELQPELRDAICIFYLILRGLDTIEDDMTIPLNRKVEVLRNFHKSVLTPGWTFTENDENEKDRVLLLEFAAVVEEFSKLKEQYKAVILDITEKMGNGMADYVLKACSTSTENDIDLSEIVVSSNTGKIDVNASKKTLLSGNRVQSIEEYNLYCHYVAGLIGHALTKLFVASELEAKALADDIQLANAMGLFLQKINITRDYFEDLHEGRLFWPKEIWGEYVENVEDLLYSNQKTSLDQRRALSALNHMCADALSMVPCCLSYLSMLREPSVFKFCAIPQVMAIATLALVFNNPDIYKRSNVKIRKGLAVKLIMESSNFENVKSVFRNFVCQIRKKNNPNENELVYQQVQDLCQMIESLCTPYSPGIISKRYSPSKQIAAMINYFPMRPATAFGTSVIVALVGSYIARRYIKT